MSNFDCLGPAPEAFDRPDGRRVLVVDDNADLARLTSHLLERRGFEVKTVLSGPAALKHARAFLPHTILLDIGLPVMDGYEVAEALRDIPETKDSLIIAISAYDPMTHPGRSRHARFNHHLVKPIDFDALLTLITPAPL